MNSTIQKLVSVVLAPIALFGVVLLVYIITYLADRVQHDEEALTVDEFAQRLMATGIVREAGLAGLLAPERNRVFRHFFEHKAFAYKKPEVIPGQEEEDEAPVKDTDKAAKTSPPLEDEKLNQKDVQEVDETEPVETETANVDVTEEADKETDLESGEEKENAEGGKSKKGAGGGAPSCSICLLDYEDGDKVMVGTRCEHMFHYDCCMQWIEKGNEICPYCRETMITAQDFLQSARELLGEHHIAKLHRINQTAARRLAEMDTSSTPNNNAPSPGSNVGASIEMAAPSSTSAAVPVASSSV